MHSEMDMTWMSIGMGIWTVLLVVLVLAVVYLCVQAGRYLRARSAEHERLSAES